MKKHHFHLRWSQVCFGPAIKAVLLLAGSTLPSAMLAASASAQFDVMIRVLSVVTQPQTGTCTSSQLDSSGNPASFICRASPAADGTGTVARPESQPQGTGSVVPGRIPAPVATNRTPSPPDSAAGARRPPTATAPAIELPAVARAGTATATALRHRQRPMSETQGTLDIYTDAATTAFRVVSWADREYIEMTVTW